MAGHGMLHPDGPGMKYGTRAPRTPGPPDTRENHLGFVSVANRRRRSPFRPILPARTVGAPLLHSCDEVADDPSVLIE